MQGEWTPYTELSPENLARAVWDALATQFNETGTMGSKLNTASSGGVDMGAMVDAVLAALNATTIPVDARKVNGRSQFFQRGTPQEVKRYFVERLARAKRTSYSQNLDERLGESMNNMQSRHALRYPFSVIEDKNPKGSAWLRQILAERT